MPRVAVGLGFLVVAAAMDWRQRKVRDAVWVALGAVALGFVEIDLVLRSGAWFLHLVSAATAILYFGVFFGEEMWTDAGFRVRPLRLAVYLAAPILIGLAAWWSASDAATLGTFYRLFTMPAMILVAHGMYYTNLLRGGADAKAVMALALLFPGLYPHIGPLPVLAPTSSVEPVLAVAFPFAFVVLVDAALLFLAAPLLWLARNAAAGTVALPRALFGYRVPIEAVPEFAWLMDRIERGRPTFAYFPARKEDREAQLRLLREHGFQNVWVTPQLPFVTALAAGYVLAVVVGNLLLAPFGGLLG